MKIKNVSRNRFVGLAGCVGLLSLLAVAMLCPMQANQTYADEPSGGATTFSGWLSSSVTLTMQDKVTETIEPTTAGVFKNLSTVAQVQVSNSDYYDVSIKGTPNMTGQVNTDSSIAAIAGEQTQSQFAANTWGYSAAKNTNGSAAEVADVNTVYKPMTSTDTAVGTQNALGESMSANDYYTLNFGAKVDTSLPADTYSSTVTLSVVASPKQVFGFDRTDTMQGMTASICNEIGTDADKSRDNYKADDGAGGVYYTKQLKDTRDGKYYWVAKLRDGNCWMVQNLDISFGLDATEQNPVNGAFGLDGVKTQLGSSTNLQWNNTPASTTTTDGMADCGKVTVDGVEQYANNCEVRNGVAHYSVERTSNVMPKAEASPSQVATKSWNQGLYVYDTPAMTTSCGSQKFGIIACSDRTTVDADGKIWLSNELAEKNKPEGDTENYLDKTKYPNGVEITGSNGVRTFIYVGDYFVNGTSTTNTGWKASTDANFFSKNTGDTYTISGSGETAVTDNHHAANSASKTFDSHYLIGNYYQWNTATAGTGGTITNADATGSICPRNWKLPTSGTDNNAKNGSFYNLLVSYGLDSKITSTNTTDNNLASWNSGSIQSTTLPNGFVATPGIGTNYDLTKGQFNIALNPLFFVRSGWPSSSDKVLVAPGERGHSYSATATNKPSIAYFFGSYSGGLYPTRDTGTRAMGFTLRCLAIE